MAGIRKGYPLFFCEKPLTEGAAAPSFSCCMWRVFRVAFVLHVFLILAVFPSAAAYFSARLA